MRHTVPLYYPLAKGLDLAKDTVLGSNQPLHLYYTDEVGGGSFWVAMEA